MTSIPPNSDNSISAPPAQDTDPTRWFGYIALAIPFVAGIGGLVYMGWMIYSWIREYFTQ